MPSVDWPCSRRGPAPEDESSQPTATECIACCRKPLADDDAIRARREAGPTRRHQPSPSRVVRAVERRPPAHLPFRLIAAVSGADRLCVNAVAPDAQGRTRTRAFAWRSRPKASRSAVSSRPKHKCRSGRGRACNQLKAVATSAASPLRRGRAFRRTARIVASRRGSVGADPSCRARRRLGGEIAAEKCATSAATADPCVARAPP
jgi:hypothetical protein